MARRFGRNQKRRLRAECRLLIKSLFSLNKELAECREKLWHVGRWRDELFDENRLFERKLRTKGWKAIKSQHDGIEQIEFIAVVDWDGDLGEEIDGAPGYKE